MAHEPKKKHSKAQKRTRRASITLKSTALHACRNCGKPALPHMICKECGFYGGKQVAEKKTVVTRGDEKKE